ncbi:hypothetical protein Vadar_032529 [Vaccinium darrowii]|uniref:Uncharacterized protein n=1 Tax=Vaccinium darrowii TaxID=229202 RepID=A0ACB7Z7M0_9ERIC|nr:hypothetical protein Vadar_032529 [Vaccinium darrowii]
MEKRKWLWKRKSSEKSPGDTESSESISSHSARYSDDQEALNASPNQNSQSPEVTSKPAVSGKEIKDNPKVLTEKLSAALANVSAKEDLVKQHAKVAEEAVAGWEKAENEVAVLKEHLEAEVKRNSVLEDRVSHLDRALKECVRQLRQGREEQEQKIHEALLDKTHEWESTKITLQNQISQFQTQLEAAKSQSPPSIDPDLFIKNEYLEKEISALTCEIISRSEELEIRTIERDLSAQAAETASKQHLESIKKVAKLEAECRRLQAVAKGKSFLGNDQKSLSASSICVESLTDSHSDTGERLNGLEIGNSWASALMTELDQFKNETNVVRKSITSSSIDIEIMDDFLEMERLASLPETDSEAHCPESVSDAKQIITEGSPLKAELEVTSNRVGELEEKLMKIEVEKAELEKSLSECQVSLEASQVQFKEAEMRLEELQKELNVVNESKELLDFQLICMEVEARTMISKVESLKEEVEKERSLAAETAVKCRDLEDELTRKSQEIETQQTAISNSKPKVNQDDLDGAAGKLAECQKTIASLGRQLQSLATLEDFLTDTANLPGISGGGSLTHRATELWKSHLNDTLMPKRDSNPSKMVLENSSPSVNGNGETSLVSSSSSSSALSSVSFSHVSSAKSQNGFGKLFSRSKSGIQLENHQA